VTSRVNAELKTDVSSVSIIRVDDKTLMMEREEISETIVFNSTLTRRIALEDFSVSDKKWSEILIKR
jgi:hypothetical protein